MITKEEFLKALEVVNNYKIQVSEQFEEMKKDLDKKDFSHLVITKDTPIRDAGLSVRALNALKANCHWEGLPWKELPRGDYGSVGDYEWLSKSQIRRFRNVGKKTIDEIERMFFQAGITLINKPLKND